MKNGMLQRITDAILILLMLLVVFFALVWFVHAFDIFPLPAPIEKLLGEKGNYETPTDDDDRVLELFRDNINLEEHDYNLLTLTTEKASELLSSFSAESSTYFWEVETTSGSGNSKIIQKHKIYKKDNKTRIDTVDASSDTTVVFANGTTIIKNNKTGESRLIKGDTKFSYDTIINVASLDYLFKENNTPVKYIGVLDQDTEKYLYIEIPKSTLDGQDTFIVSLEYGIVMSADSIINGKSVFSQKTIKFDNKSIISDETFEISIQAEAK